ncbi:Gfo/Idh/MocA family oxidoreductase [Paenibacillus sp. J5C_2022]|uniref:Gfo/Idh/MocA family protein n=1 Tax=Paenibacillus sp. J5C2022 TaxID=2977129 RepID=UPI0021D3E686|nr:Gfo/Idh/MocA family oxidoreductase [Paenibacillus sp. J5C2022]MCU6709178.1 Gfo/Idh/MocA family oxidoreductase [Paenibacillus sp. J5C2022]
MKLAVIGYGHRIRHMVKEIIKANPECYVAAIVDPREDEIRLQYPDEVKRAAFYPAIPDMLGAIKPDGVLVGTRCNLHTEMAVQLLPTGIPLFLEKPVAISYEQLEQLERAYQKSDSQVVVSFPLRNTLLVQTAKEIIDSGKLGTIEHVQAVNNVPYGGVYFHNWYRDERITNGLFLQKATHDFDYINYLLGMRPVMISAMRSKQIFKGNKPAGLLCKACDERDTCPESTIGREDLGPYCCFGEDTGNEDSGSALIQYESGMHAVYTQNFFARRQAARRGARLLGYKGTLEFNWQDDEIKVYMHHTPRVETHKLTIDDSEGHGGGDGALARNFVGIMQGKEVSRTPLEEGLLSARMCLKATESAETHTFCMI